MQAYIKRDREASKREIHFRAQIAKRRHADNSTGPKAIRQALDTQPIRPLTVLRRDEPGLRNETVGTYTCRRRELEGIARRAWDNIYHASGKNVNNLIHNFLTTYAQHIYTSTPTDINRLTGQQMQQVCTNAAPTAGV